MEPRYYAFRRWLDTPSSFSDNMTGWMRRSRWYSEWPRFFPQMVSLVTVYILKRLNQTVGKYTSPMDGMGQRGPGDYFIKPWHKDPYQTTRIWWFKFHHTLKSYEFLVPSYTDPINPPYTEGKFRKIQHVNQVTGDVGSLGLFLVPKNSQQNWAKKLGFFRLRKGGGEGWLVFCSAIS